MLCHRFFITIISIDTYTSLGCWKDKEIRAIPTLEGKISILDEPWGSRQDAIQKCFLAAKSLGYAVFAVQAGGWCASSATAKSTFKKYGQSSACNSNGKGGRFASSVYEIIEGKPFYNCLSLLMNDKINTLMHLILRVVSDFT